MPHNDGSDPQKDTASSRDNPGALAMHLFSGSPRWLLKEQTTFQFNTFHPQGLTRCGKHFFLSSVEVIEPAHNGAGVGKGHLFRADIHGALTGHIELGEDDIYHPGGIVFDGTWIWVPVAEYRPHSRSIIYRIDPVGLEQDEVFRADDHIGAVIARTQRNTLYGFSWASRLLYTWPLERALNMGAPDQPIAAIERKPTSLAIAYQDCHYLSDGLAICGGILGDYGAIELINLDTKKVIRHVPVDFIRSADGYPLTRNPLYMERHGDNFRFYFAPDDKRTILYVCEVGLGE